MNKTIKLISISLGIVVANAQGLPVLADCPIPVDMPNVPILDAGATLVEEYADGGLCRTYRRYSNNSFSSTPFSRERNKQDALSSFLEGALFIDQGFDISDRRFDGSSVAKENHLYNVATWEGRLNADVAGEYQFVVSSEKSNPYIVTINGRSIAGSGQQTLTVALVRGLGNTIYIANGSSKSLRIEYRATENVEAQSVGLLPKSLKHVVEDDAPDFKFRVGASGAEIEVPDFSFCVGLPDQSAGDDIPNFKFR